jgi:hypothetical protein
MGLREEVGFHTSDTERRQLFLLKPPRKSMTYVHDR